MISPYFLKIDTGGVGAEKEDTKAFLEQDFFFVKSIGVNFCEAKTGISLVVLNQDN